MPRPPSLAQELAAPKHSNTKHRQGTGRPGQRAGGTPLSLKQKDLDEIIYEYTKDLRVRAWRSRENEDCEDANTQGSAYQNG